MDSTTLFGNLFNRDFARRGDLYYRRGSLDKAAEMYLRAGRAVQAAEIYRELGDLDRAVEVYRQAGESREAADLLAGAGRVREASQIYEEAGFHERAAETAMRAGQQVRAGRLFLRAGMAARAAEAFRLGGDVGSAAEALERQAEELRQQLGPSADPVARQALRELERRRAETLVSLRRYAEAAELLAGEGLPAEAGPLFERAGDRAAAARCYRDAGLHSRAIAVVDSGAAVDDELRIDLYLQEGRHAEAGELLEGVGRVVEAAQAFEDAGMWLRAAGIWSSEGENERAAELFSRIGRHQEAGRSYSLAGRHHEAGEAYVLAANPRAAAGAFEEAGEPLRAAEQYRLAGESTAARDALQRIEPGDEGYGTASRLLIPMLLEEGLEEGARHRLSALQQQPGELREVDLLFLEGRIAEARGRFAVAEGFYQRVLAIDHHYDDVAERQRAVRERVDALRDSTSTHARVALEASAASGGTAPSRRPATAVAGSGAGVGVDTVSFAAPDAEGEAAADAPATAEVVVEAGAALPFDAIEPVTPWWPGTTLERALARGDRQPVFLVTLGELDETERQSLRERLREVTALRHPGVLGLRELITAGTRTVLVYEAPPVTPLSIRLAGGRPQPLASLNLLGQIASAVAGAHKLALRHQWLSPQTVLVDEDDRVRVAGFGLREVLARDTTSRAYLAPEVRDGGGTALTSDSYSLGLLAIELLQGQLPVDWPARPAVEAHRVRWPAEVEAAVPQSVRNMALACLASDPMARPSLEQLVAAINSVGLLPGQILADRYEISGELGRGGMSRVYRARDRDLGEEVAIKTVLTPQAGPSEDAERLLQEVRICRRITHPNVVRVHDFGRFPGGIFVIMELLRGPGLDEVIRDEAPVPLGRARQLLAGIAEALGEAHRLEIVHRDLKPANVLLDEGRVKVMDFGIARMGSSSAGLTQTGHVVGSPKYMAPEQIQGLELTGTCDLYALGVIGFTLLAGREPFLGSNASEVVLKHLHEPVPDLAALRPGVPAEWVELIVALLAKDPAARPQTAAEVSARLADLPLDEVSP